MPPVAYGGTERVVHYLTEELVRQGHSVTLFASGDSITSADLVATGERALRLGPHCRFPMFPHLVQLKNILERSDDFDVLHFHTEPYHFPFLSYLKTASLTTLHGRLDFPEYGPLFTQFFKQPLVSISDHQRLPYPRANWAATIYHGLPRDLYHLDENPDDHVVFLGRISPEKRVDRAIQIAGELGLRIKIAAKIDPVEQDYFNREIAHLFRLPHVEYVGEIGERDKQEFLGKAKAMLFPIDWPEPFGMVMIEAMACGTPTIAYRNGSVPEIIRDGINGYVVDGPQQAVAAVKKLERFDRRRCREHFETHFSVETMASNYISLYENLADRIGRVLDETVNDLNLGLSPRFAEATFEPSH